MPRCPDCLAIATWRLPGNRERLSCRHCGAPLRRVPESIPWSLLIGASAGTIMGLGLYLGVEWEQRFVLSWSFLAGVAAGYLFLWSQLRLRRARQVHRLRT